MLKYHIILFLKKLFYPLSERIYRYFLKEEFIIKNKHMIKKRHTFFYYWDDIDNLGDYLNTVVIRWFLEKSHLKSGKKNVVFCIGSVLDICRFNAIIWGSGFLKENSFNKLKGKKIELDIRLVRGPLSRNKLLDLGFICPEKYGDPAIIMPLIYTPPINKFY